MTRANQIYTDIYRAVDTGGKKIPIIIAYSPYGKGGSGANLMDVVPYRVGVPKSRQSGLEKFEGFVARSSAMRTCSTKIMIVPIRTSGAGEAMPLSTPTREDRLIAKENYTTLAGKKVKLRDVHLGEKYGSD